MVFRQQQQEQHGASKKDKCSAQQNNKGARPNALKDLRRECISSPNLLKTKQDHQQLQQSPPASATIQPSNDADKNLQLPPVTSNEPSRATTSTSTNPSQSNSVTDRRSNIKQQRQRKYRKQTAKRPIYAHTRRQTKQGILHQPQPLPERAGRPNEKQQRNLHQPQHLPQRARPPDVIAGTHKTTTRLASASSTMSRAHHVLPTPTAPSTQSLQMASRYNHSLDALSEIEAGGPTFHLGETGKDSLKDIFTSRYLVLLPKLYAPFSL